MANYQSIQNVNNFESLIEYLRDELDWQFDGIEDVEDALYEYDAEDFGLEAKHSAKINSIKQIVPFVSNQPWGIFWIDFGKQKPSVTAMRGLLRGLVKKKRESANESDRQRFALGDLLFILTSEDFNKLDFAYFRGEEVVRATLAIFGWRKGETHLRTLSEHNLPKLQFPVNPNDRETWLKQWREAFDVEKVTQKFFERYEEIFREVEMEIGRYFLDEASRTMFTQRLFNRLMFLYFVQKKGWMSFEGNKNYLQTLFKKSQDTGENFYEERLLPLFFNGLNTTKEKRESWVQETIGEVEFLNGGLFERDADGFDAKGKVKIPNLVFEKIFQLFAQYNFTVEESTPMDVQVAVDPEMLGKVFEELVTGRHSSGSYYTPRPVVSFMCRESLKHYLSPLDSAEVISAFVDGGNAEHLKDAEAVFEALKRIRVCDPACGSGAYILGMLQELMRLRTALFASINLDENSAYKRKREIIENNLYGVDKDNFAVQVARLRLWLALAIDSDTAHPLPNLDYKVGCGDSLLAPIDELQPSFERNRLKEEFRRAKESFTKENDSEKKQELRETVEQLRREIAESLNHTEKTVKNPSDIAFTEKEILRIKSEIERLNNEIPKEKNTKTLNEKRDFHKKLHKQLKTLNNHIAESKDENVSNERYDSKGIFDWTVEFLEVFDTPKKADSGFDVILANPPYVRQEEIPKEIKPQLLKIYYEAMTGKSDLFVAFYARGLQMLKTSGTHIFVCSNSWLDVGYGGNLQDYLLKNSRVASIYDSAIERQFASADVNTIISFIQKQTPNDTDETRFVSLRAPFTEAIANDKQCRIVTKTRRELLASGANENGKYEGDKWGGKFLRAPDIYFTILEKGKDKLVRLGSIADVRFGIKTGANEFFYLSDDDQSRWQIEPEFLQTVIKSPRECRSIFVKQKDLKFKLFVCHKDKKDLKGTNALRYIEHGETDENWIDAKTNKLNPPYLRPSCRGRRNWYDVGVRKAPPIISPSGVNEFYRAFLNTPSVLIDKCLYEVYCPNSLSENLAASLNATLTSLMFELGARTGLGEGLLFLTVYELKNCFVLNPTLINSPLFDRPVKKWREEIQQSDRRELDDIIFDALDLTTGEREAVYEAVVDLVSKRLQKANTISS